jgi:6-phosphogluconolactonase
VIQIKALIIASGLTGIMLLFSNIAGAAGESQAPPGRRGEDPGKCLVYVGTYTGAKSKGIYGYQLDLATGSLTALGLAAETPNPSFLDINPRKHFLYAANEIDHFGGKASGAVSAFSIDPATGKLSLLNQRPSIGTGPCHLVLDRGGRNLLVANYNSGSITALPIGPDGRLGETTAFIQHAGKSVHPERQEGPHAHCLALDAENRFALACDLGLDKILIYRFDAKTGKLVPSEPAFAQTKSGAGPRHLVFHPDGRHLFLINELDSTITVFDYDSAHGAMRETQTIPALPDDFKAASTAAEIAVHPSGKFLYASNRGHDSIAVFAIDPAKGTLTLVGHQPSQGKTPRHFGIDPTGKYLLAANQDSNTIVVFTIDPATGALKPAGQTVQITAPACVTFLQP